MRKTYSLNETTKERTPATTNTDKDRYTHHRTACKWYNDGANVAIVNGETGDIILIWKH